MAKKIPLQNVISPRHLSAFVFWNEDPAITSRQRLDVYTGWILINVGSSNLGTEEIISFVPSPNFYVWNYKNVSLNAANAESNGLDVTVTVAPSELGFSNDFDNIGAVYEASVALEKQPQLGIPGDEPKCLVLRAKIGAKHADVKRITYQVMVKGPIIADKLPPGQGPHTIQISGNSEPA